jgi:hypothetical protein
MLTNMSKKKKKMNANEGVVTRSCGNTNENNNRNITNDEEHEHESSDIQEGHSNMPNGPKVDMGNVNTNTLFCSFLSQNAMLIALLKSQANKSSNDIMIAPDLNKFMPVFNVLQQARKLRINCGR